MRWLREKDTEDTLALVATEGNRAGAWVWRGAVDGRSAVPAPKALPPRRGISCTEQWTDAQRLQAKTGKDTGQRHCLAEGSAKQPRTAEMRLIKRESVMLRGAQFANIRGD